MMMRRISLELTSKGLLVVVSGPSGSGKSTLCKLLLENTDDNFGLVTSHTSRNIRPGEKHGEDYYFLSREEFQKNIDEDAYLEWAEVHGNFYGTPRDQVHQFLETGLNVLLEIDVQGGLQVRGKIERVILIFISTATFGELCERLRGRGTDSEEVIKTRIHNANMELRMVPNYDYLVINDELQQALFDIRQILSSEKKRIWRLNINDYYDKLQAPKIHGERNSQ